MILLVVGTQDMIVLQELYRYDKFVGNVKQLLNQEIKCWIIQS